MSRFKEQPFAKQFRVAMTESEKAEARERYLNIEDELVELRVKEKQRRDQAAKDIDAKEGQLNALRLDIRVGVLTDVPCVRKFDFVLGEVTEIRTDTGEVVGTRKMTDADRQNYLPGDDFGEGGKA